MFYIIQLLQRHYFIHIRTDSALHLATDNSNAIKAKLGYSWQLLKPKTVELGNLNKRSLNPSPLAAPPSIVFNYP